MPLALLLAEKLGVTVEDLFKLEEEILYPSSTQVAVFLSVNVGEFFKLDSVTLKLDDKEVSNYLYTEREVQALHRGGAHGAIGVEIEAFEVRVTRADRPHPRGIGRAVEALASFGEWVVEYGPAILKFFLAFKGVSFFSGLTKDIANAVGAHHDIRLPAEVLTLACEKEGAVLDARQAHARADPYALPPHGRQE